VRGRGRAHSMMRCFVSARKSLDTTPLPLLSPPSSSLEYINSILLTGEVAGLFAKDELLAMSADLRNAFVAARPGAADTTDNLKQYFIDCVRDNLHIVLCMSPVNPKFPERARKFPGLISGTTIDWFLPWPEEALVSVSRGYLTDFQVEADDAVKEQLIIYMGQIHGVVVEVCEEYFSSNRRHVYQTPKSFLSFLLKYKALYQQKLAEVQVKESRVNMGLKKLLQGAADVEAMKIVLAEEQKKLVKVRARGRGQARTLGRHRCRPATASAIAASFCCPRTPPSSAAGNGGHEQDARVPRGVERRGREGGCHGRDDQGELRVRGCSHQDRA
jgi:hypothetical protein